MKKLILFILVFSLGACTSSKKDDSGEGVTTPPPRTGAKPKIPAPPKSTNELALGKLPTTVTKKQLAKATLFSMFENNIGDYVDTFFNKGIFDAASPYPAGVKAQVAMMATMLKKEMKRGAEKGFKEMRGRTFRDFFQSVGHDGGILYGVVLGIGKRPINQMAYFKVSDMKGLMARFERGEFGILKKAPLGGELSQKGVMNSSSKRSLFFTTAGDHLLLTTELLIVKPGLDLARASFKMGRQSVFAFNFGSMEMVARKMARELRYMLKPFHRPVLRYIKDTKWFSFVAHKPNKGEYLFTAFQKFVKGSKGMLAAGAVKSKTAMELAPYVDKKAIAFGVDAMDLAPFKRLHALYTKKFSRLLKRAKKQKHIKPLKLMVAQGKLMGDLLTTWSGKSAGSLTVNKGSFALTGVFALNAGTKEKALIANGYKLIKGFLPASLAKVVPARDAREIKSLKRFITFKLRNKRFGRARGATLSVRIKWNKMNRRKLGLSRSEFELFRFLIGPRVELSFAAAKGKAFVALAPKNSAAALKAVMKGKGGLPAGHSAPKALALSSVYGVNLAGVLAKYFADALKIPGVKKSSSFTADLKLGIKYLKQYMAGSWAFFNLGSARKILIGTLRFQKDAVRIPSVLGFTAYSASRQGFRLNF